MKSTSNKQRLLESLYKPYIGCNGCHFNMPKATQLVWGEGNIDSPILFIGEAPGKDEDIQGKPFVGRSGKLLNKILENLGSARNNVFITNIVKCRPPNNRRPLAQEIEISRPLLYAQIDILKPRIICTLGSAALEGLLDEQIKITKRRGTPISWRNLTIIPAYHPAYILRNPKELQTLTDDIGTAIKLSHQK